MSAWHEDDAFWETWAPSMFEPSRWGAAPQEVVFLLALLELPPGARILDMPCGPGRHSLELARRGYRVTGLDRTEAHLREAGRRAADAALEVEWVHGDMRAFRRPEAFDAALNLYTSFGYFADPEEDRRVLENFHASLRPGGRLVIDLMGKEILARIFNERDWVEGPDGTLWLEERSIRSGWDWIDLRWIAVSGERRVERRMGHRLYGGTELAGLLAQVGFAEVVLLGDMAGAPYDHYAQRLVAVARKAG